MDSSHRRASRLAGSYAVVVLAAGCVAPDFLEPSSTRAEAPRTEADEAAAGAPAASHFLVGLGLRRQHADAFAESQDQDALRFDYDVRPTGWPLWLVGTLGFGSSTENDPFDERQGRTLDLGLGARGYAEGPLGSHLQGTLGIAWIYGAIEEFREDRNPQDFVLERASSLGGFAGIGLLWQVDRYAVGIDLRFVRALERGEWFEDSGSLAHDEVTVFLGFGW